MEETSTRVPRSCMNAAYSSGDVVSGLEMSRVTRLTSLNVEVRVMTGRLRNFR